jgi:hypothetical protein
VEIEYQDTVTLLITGVDEYGSETVVDESTTVPAAIELNTAAGRARNRSEIDGAPRVYVDPTDEFVQDNYYRLEGALVIMALFGAGTSQSWWRVTKVEVARSHQLDNEIDNVTLSLAKTAPIAGVS